MSSNCFTASSLESLNTDSATAAAAAAALRLHPSCAASASGEAANRAGSSAVPPPPTLCCFAVTCTAESSAPSGQACVARLHITVTAGYPEHAAACRVTIQPTAVHHHVHGMPLGGVSHTHTHQSSVTLPPQGLGGSPGLGPAQGLQHRDLGSDPLSRHRRRWAEEMTGRVAAAAREAALQAQPCLHELVTIVQEEVDAIGEMLSAAAVAAAADDDRTHASPAIPTPNPDAADVSPALCSSGEEQSGVPGAGTGQASAQPVDTGITVVLLRIDHMRNRRVYTKTIGNWIKQLKLTGRLLFQGHLILVLLEGPAEDVDEYVLRQRTERVDIDSQGRKCKEHMMMVIARDKAGVGLKCFWQNSEQACEAFEGASCTWCSKLVLSSWSGCGPSWAVAKLPSGISTCGETRREGALQHAAAGDGIGPADAANAAEQADAASDVDCAALGQDSCHNPDCVWCSSAAVKSKCYTPAQAKRLPAAVFKCETSSM
ncbi:MAG: hypothetical protein WDW38_006923 [Sanguina aurantia]